MRISDWSSDVCSSDLRVRLREETDVRKTRFSEEQIIAVLREQEGGMKTADVCRKHGISSATLYAWKAKYGGMDVSQARKLKVLEEENARQIGRASWRERGGQEVEDRGGGVTRRKNK